MPFDMDLASGDQIIERHYNDVMVRLERSAGAVFIAENDSRVAGYVCVLGSVTPEDADEKPDPYSVMAELFVRPDCRGLGIGRALVRRAERYAAGCGAYKLELKVLARNEAAVGFYQALGFAPRIITMSKRIGRVVDDPVAGLTGFGDEHGRTS